MNAVIWIKIWFAIVLLAAVTAGMFNFIIDPYGFNKKILINNINVVKEDNTRFTIKYKMPRLRKGGWDNLMLGTSKIGVMDTDVVDKYLNGKTFNMSLPASAMPPELDAFLYAIKFNNIKNIIYGIDFMTFNKNLKFNDDYIQLKDELQSFGRFYTYDLYFNISTLKASIRTILNNSSDHPKLHPFYSESGVRNYVNFIQELHSGDFDMQKRINKLIQEFFAEWVYVNYEYSPEYMQLFKKIVSYCHENNINLYVYIPPMYCDHFYALRESGLKSEFEKFKRELVKITDFIDFTGVNSVTTNKNNFWDSTHLRIENTETVMAKLFQDENNIKYQDFGVKVTQENIEEHLKIQDRQYKKINLKERLDADY